MRRAGRFLLVGLAALLGLIATAVAVALLVLNTPTGARLIERQAGSLTGGMVRLAGVGGGFPSAPRIGRIEIADADGVWLSIEDAALDWRPGGLLSGVADATSLTARRIAVLRLPRASGQPATGGGFSLPVRVELRHVRAERIDIAAAVARSAPALSLDGHASVRAVDDLAADVTVTELDAKATARAYGSYGPSELDVRLDLDAPQDALARLGGLPELGAVGLHARVAGPRSKAAMHLALAVGPARLGLEGTLDLVGGRAALDVTGSAPAMTPGAGVSFASVELAGHVAGPFAAPEGRGHVTVTDLAASGGGVRRVAGSFTASLGNIALQTVLEGVRLPGPKPDLIEAEPVRATAELKLAEASKPITFSLSHPLLHVAGSGHLAPTLAVSGHVAAPDLAPFAALGGVSLHGATALDVVASQADVAVDGTLSVSDGPGPVAALIGPAARLGVTARLGPEVTISRLTLDGATVRLAATGHAGARIGVDATVELPDLRAAAPTLSGNARLHAVADGTPSDLALDADLQGDITTRAAAGHVSASLHATGLPASPSGRLAAEGQLDGAPLALAAGATRAADGSTRVVIDRADWRSAHAEGAFALAAGARLPTGHLAARMARLEELRGWLGMALSGSVQVTAELSDRLVTASLRAERAGIPGSTVRQATLDLRAVDPLGALRLDAKLVAAGLQAGGAATDATVTVAGPRTALAIRADARAAIADGPASVSTRAVLDLDRQAVSVSALEASGRGQTVRLLAPARVSFGDMVAVDRLRLGLREAVLEVGGRVSPTLDVTASLRRLPVDLAAVADPALAADGVIDADARLTGTPARPNGTLRLDATGLRLRHGPGRALPPLSVAGRAVLSGQQARLDVALSEGPNRLAVTGSAPIDPAAAIDLRATGGIDLAVLDPLLAAGGRHVQGRLALDAGVTGTLAAPRASGTARLSGGEVQDFTLGVRLDRVEAMLAAAGDTLRLQQLSARAGTGSISASGTIGLAAAMPVDLRVTARDATPLASDRLTALLDADLTARGTLRERLSLAGTIALRRVTIQVPERLPASIPVLNVIRPGAPPPPPPAAPLLVGLNLDITSPGQIFVRGRGIDAELEGKLHLGGTSAQPQPSGGFTLRRGSFAIAGKTLTFTSGSVTFNGAARIDPAINFVATSSSASVTATLTIGGTASDPKITLSSVPTLPQDEVLAQLLFGQSATSLGPFQLAEIAAALAQLSGVAGSGFDPLGAVRQGLGLDRLSVGGGGSSPNVEAGRYVSQGVYVGAKQATSGGGTQAVVQIDLTKGLKLETTVGTGGGSAQGSAQSGTGSAGTGVGLTYQFQY